MKIFLLILIVVLISRRPFKGSSFYEWQVGPIVLQMRHAQSYVHGGKFNIWRDHFWFVTLSHRYRVIWWKARRRIASLVK